jgi:hypothetical protein
MKEADTWGKIKLEQSLRSPEGIHYKPFYCDNGSFKRFEFLLTCFQNTSYSHIKSYNIFCFFEALNNGNMIEHLK